MRILYITYSRQSGVIDSVAREFHKKNIEVTIYNVAENFNFRLKNHKLPSLKFHDVTNTIIALLKFGNRWKSCFYRTDYAFKHMSKMAQNYIKANADRYDAVFQSGVLFSSYYDGMKPPFYLYIDHTYNISKNYVPFAGEVVFQSASCNWEKMERAVYHQATRVFTMSNFVKNSLLQFYDVNEKKIAVVGAGPNLQSIPEQATPKHNNNILFVGIEFWRKGGKTLLEAFKLVKKVIPDAKLTIVGPEIDIDCQKIVNVGKADFNKMPSFYKDASMFVMPTLREPFGLVFLEAMAYALPCIGTNIEAIPEIISDGESGFTVKPKDPEELATRIIALLKDSKLADKMGAIGRQRVIERFNWPHVCQLILDGMSNFA